MKKNKGRKRYNKVKAKRVKAYTGFNPRGIKLNLESLKGKKPIKQKDGFDAVDFEKEDTTTVIPPRSSTPVSPTMPTTIDDGRNREEIDTGVPINVPINVSNVDAP